eukprot:9482228-Pyramimonas_sp.AAC.2
MDITSMGPRFRPHTSGDSFRVSHQPLSIPSNSFRVGAGPFWTRVQDPPHGRAGKTRAGVTMARTHHSETSPAVRLIRATPSKDETSESSER